MLFALPVAAGLPKAFVYLLLAGGVAAALIAASATAVSLAAILGEDVVQGLSWEPASNENRVWITRVFVAIAACCGGLLTLLAPTDPLRLVLWALSLTAASLFPIMVLSIWWKRLTTHGALAGMISGFRRGGFRDLRQRSRTFRTAKRDCGQRWNAGCDAGCDGGQRVTARSQPSCA